MMNLKPFFVVVTLLMAMQAFAQRVEVSSLTDTRRHQPGRSNVPVWLTGSAGVDFAECYDGGTLPFRYTGFGANAKGGVTVEWGHCHLQTEVQGCYTALSSPTGTATDVTLAIEFLYRCSRLNRLNVWAGGSLQGFVDIKNIPAMQNAATGVSLYGNLCATGMMEYDFAFNREKTHPWLTAYGKMSLPLVGVVSRPGYSYLGHPNINENAWLAEHETFAKFFPGASTDLGLYLNLRNGNRIGLSYRWDYLTTSKKGTYRYDNALHSVNLHFMFSIN